MSSEAYEERYIERQVDAVFEDVSHMTARERMGIVAFDLLALIEEERSAQDEIQSDWFERDKDVPKASRKSRPPFGKAIFEGFVDIGKWSSGWSAYASDPVYNYRPDATVEIPDELSDEPIRLERARTHIRAAKEVLTDMYNLTPRQIEKAEKKARRLKP